MDPVNFTNHPVFERLTQLNSALQKQENINSIGINHRSSFVAFHEFAVSKLNTVVPALLMEDELTYLNSEIEGLLSSLNNFFATKDPNQLITALSLLNNALNRIKSFPTQTSLEEYNPSKQVATLQATLNNSYSALESQNNRLNAELEGLQNEIKNSQSKLVNLQIQLDTKEAEIQNALSNHSVGFENLKNNFSSTFEIDKKRFNEEVASDRKTFANQFQNEKEVLINAFQEQQRSLDLNSAEIIQLLNNKLEEAKRIVNIVGNVGVTGNYQNIANDHKKQANIFRWITLGVMALMSALLVWTLIELSFSEFNPYKSLIRILAAALLTYPAVYASRESNKHRTLETLNRNLELELASIGPFIELLPEANKQKIIEDMVAKYFGNTMEGKDGKVVSSLSDNGDDVSINGLDKILKTILPFVKK